MDARPPSNAARLLPTLLDLQGSVTLAGALEDDSPSSCDGEREESELAAYADDQLAVIERCFADVFAGRVRISSPTRMRRELRDVSLASPTAARVIKPPFLHHRQMHLANLRAGVASLRSDLAPRLASLSTRAARLEALDAALAEAVGAKVDVLLARLVARLDAHFTSSARAALGALPDPYRVTDLDPWFAAGGFVTEHLVLVGGLLQAVFAHEAGRLRALARAASERRSQ